MIGEMISQLKEITKGNAERMPLKVYIFFIYFSSIKILLLLPQSNVNLYKYLFSGF